MLDLVGRASGRRLIDLVARPRRNAVKPMWLLGNKTAEEDVAEAHAQAGRRIRFLQAQDRREAAGKGDRDRLRGARGAAGHAALRRRQLRADARRCTPLCRENSQSQTDVRRAAACLRRHRRPPQARARNQGADRHRRGHPFARRYRGERQGRRRRRVAQADQARRHHRRGRGRQALPAARPCR